MKKTTIFLLLQIMFWSCIPSFLSAKTWRVNSVSNYNGTSLWGDNLGGTVGNPVFAQLIDVVNSNLVDPVRGDTVHLEGAVNTYSTLTLTKKLIIIGTGYLLSENPKTSNSPLESKLFSISFGNNSSGSQLIGVYVTGNDCNISAGVSDITIKRCRLEYSIFASYNNTNLYVLQNYFSNTSNSQVSAITLNANGFPSNFIFNNNISKRTLILFDGANTRFATEVKNNVFDCPAIAGSPSIRLLTDAFQNNILKNSAATVNINNGTSTNVSFNVSASASNQFGTGNNNLVETDMSLVFVNPALNSSDGDYQLSSTWTADINHKGADGADRGAFGGASVVSRYTLSGLAAIPVIYDIATPGVADASGLQVTIQARTIK